MPMAPKSKDEDETPIVIAVYTFSLDGATIHDGFTYRKSDPAVRAHPDWFLPWPNSTSGEQAERRAQIMESFNPFG
jgi:hypothetical protein